MNPLLRTCHPFASILLLSLIGTACGSSTDPSNQNRPTPFQTSHNLWKSKGLTDYRFTFNWNCFCTAITLRQVKITVREGVIAQIIYADDNSPVDPQRWDEYRTVDQLFEFLQQAYDLPAFQISAQYNSTYGYPAEASVDYQEQIADEEKGFRITGFEIIP